MNKNTDRTLDVVFSRFRGFLFTITLRQKRKVVIVNEKLLNLEKTRSSVRSVLLINLWIEHLVSV